MAKVRNCVWVSPSSILTIAHNLFRQFLNVTFYEIFCKLVLFLFYGAPAEYITSGYSWWLLWPKCQLEPEFDCRFRLRFSKLIQLNQTNCEIAKIVTWWNKKNVLSACTIALLPQMLKSRYIFFTCNSIRHPQ